MLELQRRGCNNFTSNRNVKVGEYPGIFCAYGGRNWDEARIWGNGVGNSYGCRQISSTVAFGKLVWGWGWGAVSVPLPASLTGSRLLRGGPTFSSHGCRAWLGSEAEELNGQRSGFTRPLALHLWARSQPPKGSLCRAGRPHLRLSCCGFRLLCTTAQREAASTVPWTASGSCPPLLLKIDESVSP